MNQTENSDYKRQIDFWIKLSVIATPMLSAAVSWGVIKTTVVSLESRMTRIEEWIDAQTKAGLVAATGMASAAEAQHETNRRLERIEVILDSRLKEKG